MDLVKIILKLDYKMSVTSMDNIENIDSIDIVDAYKKFNRQLVILVSGMSGSGKNKLAENIARDFKLNIIRQSDFYKKPYSNDFTLFDGSTITNWFTYDAYDWDRLNKEIGSKKSDGVVVIGLAFPTKHIDFKPDFSISISVKKSILLERMEKLLEKNKDRFPEKYEDFKEGKTKYIFNKLTFPFFLSSIEDSPINKFINANDTTDDEIYDNVFDYIVPEIEKRVYKIVKSNSNNPNKSAFNSLKDLIDKKNREDSESITSESTEPLEFVEHKDNGESPYEDTQSVDENGDNQKVNGYEYGLKGDYLYW